MNKRRRRLKELLERYTTNAFNTSELEELLNYFNSSDGLNELDEEVQELFEQFQVDEKIDVDSEKLFQNLIANPDFYEKHRRTKVWKWVISTAAVVVLAIGAFLYSSQLKTEDSSAGSQIVLKQIKGSSNTEQKYAVLKLADGREINLDDSDAGLLVSDVNFQIMLKGTQLQYITDEEVNKSGKIAMNSISIPKGKQYQVCLPDGSKIWLNAMTTITYPVQFASGSREVLIEGEAYFEVKHAENWPFIVQANDQMVEVLGTHFNISAYDDDEETKTSLVEGSVRVSLPNSLNTSDINTTVLTPGHQSVIAKNGKSIKVEEVDTEEVVSWRNNLFVFSNEPIRDVMRKVSRWYDVQIVVDDAVGRERIGGTIPRFENIEEVMGALKATSLLDYRMKGGKVIITE